MQLQIKTDPYEFILIHNSPISDSPIVLLAL